MARNADESTNAYVNEAFVVDGEALMGVE